LIPVVYRPPNKTLEAGAAATAGALPAPRGGGSGGLGGLGPVLAGVAARAFGVALLPFLLTGDSPQPYLSNNSNDPSLDDLSRAAAAASGKGGLSRAGRALQKHGDRPGSAFPAAKGRADDLNSQGQEIVDGILNNQNSVRSIKTTGRFGDVIDIVGPDGRGVRFTKDGKIVIGFLEPERK